MRVRKTQNEREFESVIDDYITRGYEVEDRGQRSARLKEDTGYGTFGKHLLIFIFLGWWTFLIANGVYAWYAHTQGEEVMVKIEDDVA